MPQTPYLPHYDLIPYTQPTTALTLSNNPIKDYLDNINNMMAAQSDNCAFRNLQLIKSEVLNLKSKPASLN